MKKLFFEQLAKSINAYLYLDPQTESRIKKLNGKIITIELLPLHFIFQCCFDLTGVTLSDGERLPATSHLRGTPLQFAHVMINKKNRQSFFAEDVLLTGDAEVGQLVIELFDELNIDWEDVLSRITGDVPAYYAGRFIKDARAWFKESIENFQEDVSSYIHDEKNWLPTHEALQDFFAEIDTLRMDVDRIHQQIQLLREKYLQKNLEK